MEVFSHEISDEQLCNFDDAVLTISRGIGQTPALAASEWWEGKESQHLHTALGSL